MSGGEIIYGSPDIIIRRDIMGIQLNTLGGTSTVNSTKSIELNKPSETEAKADHQNKLDNVSETAGDTKEIKQNDGKETVKKHVLTYIAGGIWIDSNGQKWSRQPISGTDIVNVREYYDNDYQNRDDLQFMVNYGSMTITTVTL